MTDRGFDEVIAAYRDALRSFVKGDPEPAMAFFSEREDVTLANPLQPPQRGIASVGEVARSAAASFAAGGPLHFESVTAEFEEFARYATAELGYVHQIERFAGPMTGREGTVVSSLRVTLVFRREDGEWKIVHRHADPITTPRPISSVIQE